MNEVAFPANTPVYLKVTSNSAMSSSFVLRLGSQTYAMAGMQTRLHLIVNEPGTYDSISVSCSGPGFSDMRFKAIVIPDRAAFDQWITKTKQSPNTMLDMATFEKLAAFSEYNQVEYFSNMRPDLFADVANKFMAHGESMDMIQPEGEYSTHEGIEGTENMDMNHVESAH